MVEKVDLNPPTQTQRPHQLPQPRPLSPTSDPHPRCPPGGCDAPVLSQTPPDPNQSPSSEPLSSSLLPPQALVLTCLIALSYCGFHIEGWGALQAWPELSAYQWSSSSKLPSLMGGHLLGCCFSGCLGIADLERKCPGLLSSASPSPSGADL